MSCVYRIREEQPDFTDAVIPNKFFNHVFHATTELYDSVLRGIGTLEKLSPVMAAKSSGVIVIYPKGK